MESNQLIEFIKEHWQKLVVLVVVLITGGWVLVASNETNSLEAFEEMNGQEVQFEENQGEKGLADSSEEKHHDQVQPQLLTVIVDVKGQVNNPGIYELKTNQRLNDAIVLAGGFTDSANINSVNLAQKLSDEMLIYVAGKDEQLNSTVESTITSPSPSEEKALININLADSTEFQELNGIGQAKAEAIIQYREEEGYFEKIEDIKEVSGIGDKIFESLKDSITVN